MRQALFYCPELYDNVPAPRARHYHRIDDHWTLMIVQDSRKHFTLHAVVEKDEDMATLFEKIVGTPVKYEMVHCAKWVQRLLLAEHYQHGRVFIAGDAAHLVIPTGGLGMNTGVGDAIDSHGSLPRRCAAGADRTAAVLRSGAPPDRRHQRQGFRRRHRRPDEMARRIASEHRGRHAEAEPCWPTADDCEGGSAKIIPRRRRRTRLSLRRLAGDLRGARRTRAEHRGVRADDLARRAPAACLARARQSLGA